MKTISQLAAETAVSVQTVYRQLNKVKQETSEQLTQKVNGVAYFTEIGEVLVRERLTGVKQGLTPVKRQVKSDEIASLREQNKVLLEELAKERKNSLRQAQEQTKKLSDLALQFAELARNNQLLLGAEQSRANSALFMGDVHKDDVEYISFGKRIKILFTGKYEKKEECS